MKKQTHSSAATLVLLVFLSLVRAGSARAQWVEQGPGPDTVPNILGYTQVSGAIQAIAADPSDSNRVFVATVNGGIWRTTNATDPSPLWTPLTDQQPSLSMGCIAFSPLDPNHNTLYAGVNGTSHGKPQNGSFHGPLVGVLRTTDGGNSWALIGASYFTGYPVMRVLPTTVGTPNAQTVFVTTMNPNQDGPGGGVFRSDDSGQSWNKVSGSAGRPAHGLPDFSFVDIVEDPGSPQQLFTATDNPPRVFRSQNLGTNWTELTSAIGLPNNVYRPTKLTFSPTADGRGIHWIYLLADNVGIFLSTNSGSAWMQMDPPPTGGQFAGYLAVSPINADVVFSVTDADHRWRGSASAPSGSQWQLLNVGGTQPHTDGRDWVFSANADLMFESDDGGIYRLKNPFSNLSSWDSAIGNLRVTEFYSVAYDSVNHIIFGACQDNSIPQQTIPGSVAWGMNEGFHDDGIQAGVDNTSTPGVAVHYSSQQHLFEFHRRYYTSPTVVTNDTSVSPIINGTSHLVYNGFEGNLVGDELGTVRFVQTWTVNVADGRRLLMGTDYLYESFDRGDSFTSLGGIGQNVNGDPIPSNAVGEVTAYAYGHPQNADIFYIGTTGAHSVDSLGAIPRHLLWLRSSGTGPPTSIDGYQNAGGSTPYGIAMDPNDWQRAYVVDSNRRVWRTTNAGGAWTEVTANLGTLIIDLRTVVVVSRSSTPGYVTVLVGGLGGVLYATDTPSAGNLSWDKLGNLPNAIVSDLHYDGTDDVLIAGLFGRGAWKMSDVRRWLFEACHTTLRCDPFVTWVDFSYSGTETGCSDQPYNTLAEGIAHVNGQTLAIKSGATSATNTINTPMTIEACGGTVTIGR